MGITTQNRLMIGTYFTKNSTELIIQTLRHHSGVEGGKVSLINLNVQHDVYRGGNRKIRQETHLLVSTDNSLVCLVDDTYSLEEFFQLHKSNFNYL